MSLANIAVKSSLPFEKGWDDSLFTVVKQTLADGHTFFPTPPFRPNPTNCICHLLGLSKSYLPRQAIVGNSWSSFMPFNQSLISSSALYHRPRPFSCFNSAILKEKMQALGEASLHWACFETQITGSRGWCVFIVWSVCVFYSIFAPLLIFARKKWMRKFRSLFYLQN